LNIQQPTENIQPKLEFSRFHRGGLSPEGTGDLAQGVSPGKMHHPMIGALKGRQILTLMNHSG
jgi:hypothetical protein